MTSIIVYLNDFHGSGSTPVFESVAKNAVFSVFFCMVTETGRIFFYTAHQQTVHMKIIAALTDPGDASRAQEQGADMVELRLT